MRYGIGDIACSFSGKEVKNVSANQRSGWPSWIPKTSNTSSEPLQEHLWKVWWLQMK
jgi:hypothetical protein